MSRPKGKASLNFAGEGADTESMSDLKNIALAHTAVARRLHPLCSANVLHCNGDRYQKAYQCHISYDAEHHLWIGWAHHGPGHNPRQHRALVCVDYDLYAVCEGVNHQISRKCSKKQDPYAPLDGCEPSLDMEQMETLLEQFPFS